ncbi:MAG: hypothetical protein HQ477_04985 [Chloroflexi bacterium]|nr:hypothetical protein [Chloroflexota bacterium]
MPVQPLKPTDSCSLSLEPGRRWFGVSVERAITVDDDRDELVGVVVGRTVTVAVGDSRDRLIGVAVELAGVVDALTELGFSRSVTPAVVAGSVISGATFVGAIGVELTSDTAVQAEAAITNQTVTAIHRT